MLNDPEFLEALHEYREAEAGLWTAKSYARGGKGKSASYERYRVAGLTLAHLTDKLLKPVDAAAAVDTTDFFL